MSLPKQEVVTFKPGEKIKCPIYKNLIGVQFDLLDTKSIEVRVGKATVLSVAGLLCVAERILVSVALSKEFLVLRNHSHSFSQP